MHAAFFDEDKTKNKKYQVAGSFIFLLTDSNI